ncbi:MAG: DEAD/DEAH box helicase [Acidobacteriota bacterium]|nr:DEAD/DEAH box helicase [Acidobacteriota bacterium]
MSTFQEMPLSPRLKKALAASKFVTPTPVQIQAIPPALDGDDVVATAQTGTGKTLAFLIPVMEMLDQVPAHKITALVLVPTRELAIQVHEQYEALRSKKSVPAALVIGGLSEKDQIKSLKAGARLIVATPGRLEDYIRRRIVDLGFVCTLVLDEVDRMLDMGFLPSITRILSTLPKERQTLCFSATLEKSVQGLLLKCTTDAVRIAIGNILKPAASVSLQAYEVPLAHKGLALRQALKEVEGKTLIFTRTKRGTERLAKQLKNEGYSTTMIHGDRTQSQRLTALSSFEQGRYEILVATDVAARGLQIDDVMHVINYELPALAEDFIHRVGRTGRAGNTGRATTLASGAEMIELRRFEKTLKLHIERRELSKDVPLPTTASPVVPISKGRREGARRERGTLRSRTLNRLPGEVFA